MPKVVTEFPSESGPVRVEVDIPDRPGPNRVGRSDEIVETANQRFEEAVAGIRPIAEGLLAQVTGLAQAPKTIEIKFGIKLSGEVGVILASSKAEAHVEVTLGWEKDG